MNVLLWPFQVLFFVVENICLSWWLGILIGNTSFSNIFYVLGDWLCFRCQNETGMTSIVRCVMSCDKMWFAGISVYTKESVCVCLVCTVVIIRAIISAHFLALVRWVHGNIYRFGIVLVPFYRFARSGIVMYKEYVFLAILVLYTLLRFVIF